MYFGTKTLAFTEVEDAAPTSGMQCYSATPTVKACFSSEKLSCTSAMSQFNCTVNRCRTVEDMAPNPSSFPREDKRGEPF